jgi:uncharacterized protein YggE
VTGTGEASATPDIARLSAGVRAEAATAAAALDAASRAMAGIRATLDAAQIAPSDIQTTSLSLTPVWNTASGSMPGQPEIAGYRARNMVTVTVRDLDALGGLLDAVAQAGANEIGAIRFDLADPTATLDAARRAAVADARRKAALYADAAGVTLGPLLRLTDGAPPSGGPMPMPMAMADGGRPVPVAEGTLTLSADVTLTWRIAPE